MRERTIRGTQDGYGTIVQTLTQVERLESACHRVMLPSGGEEARKDLRTMLSLDLGAGFDPRSPEASAAAAGAEQITSLIAILDQEHPDPLGVRVAAARLCQTLTNIRGHLSGGRRLNVAGERTTH